MKKKTLSTILILVSFCSFAQERVTFSEKYKKENLGKYKIEINEVKELIQIMLAITNSGKENDDMVQQEGQYYQDVLNHFKSYENENIIRTFDSLMVSSPYNYIFLTGNAISYNFKGNKLVKSKVFIFPATAVANMKIDKNPITTYKDEIEKFAKKSNFRKFYSEHKEYYSGIISDYEKNANLGRQWKWLENNFETKRDSYIILCSPLINGLNYTGQFTNNNFSLIHMNLPPVDFYPNLTPKENELLNTRVMFTEIDHNYVDTPTEANKETINQIFAERKIWVNEDAEGTFAYPKPVNVFNEYMTYGVFVLYCKDHYDQATLDKVIKDITDLMTERGFPKMKLFIENLLKIRSKYPYEKIDKWYPEFLKQFEEIK
ncbi:DUF4932 domain-containing protein [Flavobacterium sp. MFBS3-15]|uniref:DUF4932 domain-containing protein n=1 Tax=Flavobacterium sp. MFBS3-15 TaxID=2989816 RepID=UPI002236A11A|nr:DUF4932 domain-containing protein [Flavobacterium sp. MFBS3-15]MCW4469512.1 DUF4932 domain-containing protein [Flavobacterium sp. MFBS3-15]